MNRMMVYLVVASALLISPLCLALDKNPQLSAKITNNNNGSYKLEFKNISDGDLQIPNIFIEDATASGYWLFLYDPKTEKLQEAWASTFQGPDMHGAPMPRAVIKPGDSVVRTFSSDEMLGYFMYIPECFYLVAIYRKIWNREMLYSNPSKPLYICSPHR